jgi:hypothetical protein
MGLFRKYTENWPKVGAVAAMALGGGSILVASRKKPMDLRTLETAAAHLDIVRPDVWLSE